MKVRIASEGDAERLAQLHATRISEGFLSHLGPGFLRLLYRRIVVSTDAFAYVATDGDTDRAVGFAAGTVDIGRLYKSFALHDGVRAGLTNAPALLRSWRRVFETLRYPAAEAAADLPRAEILAVAVDAAAAGRGVGELVVNAATQDLAARGADPVKVVCGADNAAAIRLYEKCGFTVHSAIEVHAGDASKVLVWSSSSL